MKDKKLTNNEAVKILDDLKVKIDIPKSAVTQRNRNIALDMAIQAIEEQRWIPVSEGLPPIGDEVIVTTVWGEVTKAERYRSGNEDWFIHEGATNAKTEDILAWKLRPQPYKEGDENE